MLPQDGEEGRRDFKTVTYIHTWGQTSDRNPSISLFKWNLIILQYRENVRMYIYIWRSPGK